MSRGHQHDQLIYGLSLYISREKGHQTWKPRSQRSLLPALPVGWLGENPGNQVAKHGTTIFFPITILFSENLKKNARKALVNTRIVLMPPGHPTILLKSNLFNIAAVSVKGLLFKKNICTLDSH